MNSNVASIVVVASNAELNNPHYYRRLWLAARNTEVSRRGWLDLIAFAILHFNGAIVVRPGEVWACPDIDSIFGDDPDMRWLSDYLKADETGLSPHAKSRRMERVRMIDLYFRIKHPEIARHFGR